MNKRGVAVLKNGFLCRREYEMGVRSNQPQENIGNEEEKERKTYRSSPENFHDKGMDEPNHNRPSEISIEVLKLEKEFELRKLSQDHEFQLKQGEQSFRRIAFSFFICFLIFYLLIGVFLSYSAHPEIISSLNQLLIPVLTIIGGWIAGRELRKNSLPQEGKKAKLPKRDGE